MRELRLYFLSVPERIKIGVSVAVPRRIVQIQGTIKPRIKLLGDIPGSFGFEKHLHSLLAQRSVGNEWFTDCEEVRQVVDSALAGDRLGFEPKAIASPRARDDHQTYEEFLALFNKFAPMAFPGDTAGKLALDLDISRDQAADYLSGKEIVPQIIASAFAAQFIGWMMAEHQRQKSSVTACAT